MSEVPAVCTFMTTVRNLHVFFVFPSQVYPFLHHFLQVWNLSHQRPRLWKPHCLEVQGSLEREIFWCFFTTVRGRMQGWTGTMDIHMFPSSRLFDSREQCWVCVMISWALCVVIFSYAMNVTSVELCVMARLFELYLFIHTIVPFAMIHGHSCHSFKWTLYVLFWLSWDYVWLLNCVK